MLAGLLSPTSGQIILGDNKVTELSKNELCQFRRSNMGLIFQKIHLLPHLNLLENVSLGTPQTVDSTEALLLIKRLGLENRLNHLPKELSLGETQRTSVARALIANPKIILADEPTASLDDKNAEMVFALLKEKTKGKTLLVVTHDHRARSFFDQHLNFKELLA